MIDSKTCAIKVDKRHFVIMTLQQLHSDNVTFTLVRQHLGAPAHLMAFFRSSCQLLLGPEVVYEAEISTLNTWKSCGG
jgi:hypothetical protein